MKEDIFPSVPFWIFIVFCACVIEYGVMENKSEAQIERYSSRYSATLDSVRAHYRKVIDSANARCRAEILDANTRMVGQQFVDSVMRKAGWMAAKNYDKDGNIERYYIRFIPR